MGATQASRRGLVGSPGVSRATRESQFTFVNRRPVENRGLNFALIEGYHNSLMKGRYPVCCLFLDIDPAAVVRGALDVVVTLVESDNRVGARVREYPDGAAGARVAVLVSDVQFEQPIGYVTKVGANFVELATNAGVVLNNGDGLCYYDLHKELIGLAINRAEPVSPLAVDQWLRLVVHQV